MSAFPMSPARESRPYIPSPTPSMPALRGTRRASVPSPPGAPQELVAAASLLGEERHGEHGGLPAGPARASLQVGDARRVVGHSSLAD